MGRSLGTSSEWANTHWDQALSERTHTLGSSSEWANTHTGIKLWVSVHTHWEQALRVILVTKMACNGERPWREQANHYWTTLKMIRMLWVQIPQRECCIRIIVITSVIIVLCLWACNAHFQQEIDAWWESRVRVQPIPLSKGCQKNTLLSCCCLISAVSSQGTTGQTKYLVSLSRKSGLHNGA